MDKTIESSKEEIQWAKKKNVQTMLTFTNNCQRCKLKLGDAFFNLSN